MSEGMVRLCSAESGPEAAIVMSILDAERIRYEMDSPAPAAFGYAYSFNITVGPVNIYVHKDDFNRANKLLDALSIDE